MKILLKKWKVGKSSKNEIPLYDLVCVRIQLRKLCPCFRRVIKYERTLDFLSLTVGFSLTHHSQHFPLGGMLIESEYVMQPVTGWMSRWECFLV